MMVLFLGLVLFLGAHSVRIVAEDFRARQVAQAPLRWKALYSLVSIAGFVAIVIGYGMARHNPVVLWPAPPAALRHVTALLNILAFVFIAAAYVPRNAIKARVGHPMVLGVKLWAFAHLITNNTLADLLLFGSFLVWAILNFRTARRREPRPIAGVTASGAMTVVTVVVGVLAGAAFALWAHAPLIGVRPFG